MKTLRRAEDRVYLCEEWLTPRVQCLQKIPYGRWQIGRFTCFSCGERQAQAVRHTIAPINKSNPMVITDPELLKQLNPKRTI
jgi:hypothetical protein